MKRILHLGVGNFHRAHQVVYTQDAGGWRITGVSLRSRGVIEALAPRGFDYTLAVQGPDGTAFRQIDVLETVLFAPDDPDAVVQAIATADLISLTVTEKGYCLGQDGTLDLTHPDIESDLRGTRQSAIALLADGLARRTSPVAVLSCDNLTGNGDKLAAAVTRFAEAAGLRLPEGLQFPNAMVDRITPATTDALRAMVLAQTGIEDNAPVATEPFSEWIIEAFDAPHPAWEQAGAEFVPDVAPYEARKLRLLNGAHSTLAYAGLLKGHRYVHEAIADPELFQLVDGVMEEASVTLQSGIESTAYRAALMTRFANPALHHELQQIAMDGSQKLPVRLFQTIRERQAKGLASPALWRGAEAWAEFVVRELKAGRDLNDPRADDLKDLALAISPERRLLEDIGAPPRD